MHAWIIVCFACVTIIFFILIVIKYYNSKSLRIGVKSDFDQATKKFDHPALTGKGGGYRDKQLCLTT